MDNRGAKIAIACFVGGALTVAVLIAAIPGLKLWGALIGLAAGALMGYLAYDFREVWQAIKTFWREDGRRGLRELSGLLWEGGIWLVQPRYRLWFWILPTAMLLWALASRDEALSPLDWLGLALMMGIGPIMLAAFHGLVLHGLVQSYRGIVGEEYEQRLKEHIGSPFYFRTQLEWTLDPNPFSELPFPEVVWVHKEAGYVLGQFLLGLLMVFADVPVLVWRVFRYIHSDVRVLCAIDAPLGGGLTYWWFRHTIDTLPVWGQLLVVLGGGVVAVLLGLANYEILSKRILQTLPEESQN